jgi:ATP-dependent exoDNAse (exonuclease V) beta subunit
LPGSLFTGATVLEALFIQITQQPQVPLTAGITAEGVELVHTDTQPDSTLVVHAYGQQRRMEDSSAFYNTQEAELLVEMLLSLISEHQALAAKDLERRPVTDKDIAVICLSRAQVVYIRNLLRSQRLGNINVGTVDDFQGQEVRVTFVSTVLTAPV